jgi:predicted acyltransferase
LTHTDLIARKTGERLFSLDFFRGFTMFLLIAESTEIYALMVSEVFDGTVISVVGTQFHHHPWHGLRFWDLIQPYFMFIVGVAMPYSLLNRRKRGQTDAQIRKHILQRALLLLLLGWALYCISEQVKSYSGFRMCWLNFL